jgi:hypothetical protein
MHKVHHLVWDAFREEPRKGLDVDHIDGNTINNHLDNLQLLTHRANVAKGHRKNRALPTGVYYLASTKKYIAYAVIQSKTRYLGIYKTPEEASAAYQKAVINN